MSGYETRGTLPPGLLVGDRYRVLSMVGLGGMGEVYKVEDVKAKGDALALKLLPTENIRRTPESLKRFQNEFEIGRKLTHPNIIQMHELGKSPDGSPYIVMEYLGGGTLKHRISKSNPLPFPEVVRILLDTAKALAFAHSQDVIHRDLKPDNVLFSEGGHVKLGDFGLARDTEVGMSLTLEGDTVGTVLYMAPEQVTRQVKLDGRVDIYSLGVMAWEMIACEPAFRGGDTRAVMKRQLTMELPEVRLPSGADAAAWAKAAVIPGWFIDFVAVCAKKDREERFPTMDAVVRTLEKRLRKMTPQHVEPQQGFFKRLFGR